MPRQFLTDFAERCKEVEEYLCLIRFYDDIATNKKTKLKAIDHYGNEIDYTPSNQTQQILRSSFYVIVYNLIEATANSIITSVLDQINDEKVPLVELKDRIVILYVRNKLLNKNDKNRINYITEVMKDVKKKRHVKIDGFRLNISGNVDYDFITEILKNIGCVGRIPIDSNSTLKDIFLKIKTNRNELAHGNKLFSTNGSVLILKNLECEYWEVKAFFKQVLENLESFLDTRRYIDKPKT